MIILDRSRIAFCAIISIVSSNSYSMQVLKPIKSYKAKLSLYRFFSILKKSDVASKLEKKDFQELAMHARSFLNQHMNKLACQKNESGFFRVNMPVPKNFMNRLKKIRLNYWDIKAAHEISPESIHNHPNYFESIILHGGYSHAIYDHTKSNDGLNYSKYRIFKNQDSDKSFMFLGNANLKHLKDESVQKDSIVVFSKKMIHRVLETQPLTLTLNVVFKDEGNEEISDYDVYISESGSFLDVKTERESLIFDDSKKIVSAMKYILDKYLESK